MKYRVFYESSFNRGSITELEFQAAGDLMAMAIADPNVGGSVGSLSREDIQAWKRNLRYVNNSPIITTKDFAYDIEFRIVPQKQDVVAMVENMVTGETLYLNREVFRKLGLPIPMPMTTPSMPYDDNDPIWLKSLKK